MEENSLNRRDFQRLTAAAIGGLMAGAGSLPAFGQDAAPKKDPNKNPMLGEPHVCRGINMCKSLGTSKDNACAGQGACATAKAHACHFMNECRGQGGCGAKPGENECKQKGECGVPMSGTTWQKCRKRFEELMKVEGKQVGPAPPPKRN